MGPNQLCEDYNQQYGSPLHDLTEKLCSTVKTVYASDDWASYFEGLYLKPKGDEFVANILVESMGRARDKGYYVSNHQQPIMDPGPPQQTQQSYSPQQPYVSQGRLPATPRICHKFEELSPPLAACLEECETLPLQAEALPLISAGTQSVIISPLGTGKHTLAAITVVNTLIQSKKGQQVLVLVPEKNQAIHFEEILSDIYVHVPESEMHPHRKITINVILCLAKEPYPREKSLQHRTVMVGTPGRSADLLRKKIINPEKMEAVYILEGDVLLSLPRTRGQTFECFQSVFSGIQTVFMAATWTPYLEEVSAMILDPETDLSS